MSDRKVQPPTAKMARRARRYKRHQTTDKKAKPHTQRRRVGQLSNRFARRWWRA